ncbi:MAG: ABC transporter ATP-binding protein [Mycoplasmatales bacterium]
MRTILKLENIEKFYGNKQTIVKALDNLSLTINEGEFVAIMGASGSGKTTLLNTISIIDDIDSGTVLLNGNDISKLKPSQIDSFRSAEIGFIFQEFNLLDSLTAYDNIALALSLVGSKNIDEKISNVAESLGLTKYLHNYPNELSGGQQQRVAIARALVKEPSIILADEPTGALDFQNTQNILKSLIEINQKNVTILMVTHDSFAASYASKVIFLKDGKIFTSINRNPELTRSEFHQLIIDNELVVRS